MSFSLPWVITLVEMLKKSIRIQFAEELDFDNESVLKQDRFVSVYRKPR
jgi:hypothetical protein